MTSMQSDELEEVSLQVLSALRPTNTGSEVGPLLYDERNERAHIHNASQGNSALKNFLLSAPGSLAEKRSLRTINEIELSKAAHGLSKKISESERRSLADVFTQRSLTLYGDVDMQMLNQQMSSDLAIFYTLKGDKKVDQLTLKKCIESYEQLGVKGIYKLDDKKLHSADKLFKDYLIKNYGFVLAMYEPKKLYGPEDIMDSALTIIKKLSASDPRWSKWSVMQKQDGSMNVDAKKKMLLVGIKRAPSTGKELGPIMLHEFIAHALRGVNGAEKNDPRLGSGLVDYLIFEEGLGCYMEYVLGGRDPSKVIYRQMTGALALGRLNGARHDRHAVYLFLKRRHIVMSQAENTKENVYKAQLKELRRLVIDRFFRGGSGVGSTPAVYTKDVVYAKGLVLVKNYMRRMIDSGVDAEELFDYVLSAKFNPVLDSHISLLAIQGIGQPQSTK